MDVVRRSLTDAGICLERTVATLKLWVFTSWGFPWAMTLSISGSAFDLFVTLYASGLEFGEIGMNGVRRSLTAAGICLERTIATLKLWVFTSWEFLWAMTLSISGSAFDLFVTLYASGLEFGEIGMNGKKLRSCLKSGKTMEEYVGEMKQVFDQLHSIDFPMTEQEKIYALLSGLGKEYEPVTTVIEHSMDTPPGPYYEDVVFKLIAFDDKQQSYSSAPEVTPHLVFHTEKSYYDKGGSTNRGGRSGNRGRGNYSTKGRGFQQHGNGQNNDSSRPTCQICGKYGHSAFKCYNRFNESYSQPSLPTAMAALRISDEEHRTGNDWLPDTAATAHITNSVNNLQQSQPYQGHDSVMVGNGDFLPITHIGTIPLQTLSGKPLPLNDVLVCPDVARNLLSVSKLCSDTMKTKGKP
ncbi:unnamed protein product [Arabidopsis halleri]